MGDFKHNKAFGQHFLKSNETAARIVQSLQPISDDIPILEIGPGLGVLSSILLAGKNPVFFSEIDRRIIQFLQEELRVPQSHILQGDFLNADLTTWFQNPFVIIGNFPYNISSQIVFAVLEHKQLVPTVVGMFQREMALRVVANHGNKDYGILSVLTQAYFRTTYLFELPPEAFDPPPKVHSAVIKLERIHTTPDHIYPYLRTVVKTAFNQRRKTLSNALSGINGAKAVLAEKSISGKRAEELSVAQFIELTETLFQLKK